MTRTAVGAALLGLGIAGGWFARSWAATDDPFRPLETLVRVIGLVETTYVDPIGTDELVGHALRGLTARLDPHSAWLDAASWDAAQREAHGTRAGLGLEVRFVDGGAEVTRVLPGGPAERAGVERGDVLVAIDGGPVDADAARASFLGERGQEVVLTVQRPGEAATRKVRARRDVVRVPAVADGALAPGVGYVRIATFSAGAAVAVDAALARLPPDTRSLVLDLRDNGGGLLDEAVAVADRFLADGTIVRTVGRVAGANDTRSATPGAWAGDVVVLVNGRSASAAEVVAAALQDRGRARLVGTRTYGKGTVQTVYEHRDGSALRLTVARYLTPSGAPVAPREGRAPDVLVPWPGEGSPRDALRAALDALDVDEADKQALRAHVDALPDAELRAVRSPIPWELPVADRLASDPQLAAALALLR